LLFSDKTVDGSLFAEVSGSGPNMIK